MQVANQTPISFVEALYTRAETYLNTQAYGPYATLSGRIKGIFLVLLYAGAYAYFLLAQHSFASLLGTAVVLSLLHVLLPVNIGHDAIHQTLSPRAWVNDLALLSLELTGANSFMYRKKHLEAHRNKELGSGANPIETQQLLLKQSKKNTKVNLPYVCYLFYSMYMIFIRDIQLFTKEASMINGKEWRNLLLAKFLYACAFLLLPFLLIELPVWQIASALLLMYFIVTVLLVIILLMPTEKMKTTKLSEELQVNEQWVLDILAQNVDFSPTNRFLNLLAGGANLNVVHYLFSGVHHTHYNKLATLIQTTCNEYGVHYRQQSVKDVIGVHFTYIKNIQQHDENTSLELEISSPSTK